jgi:hypothetical protein
MIIVRFFRVLSTLFVRSQPSNMQPSLLRSANVPLVFIIGVLLFSLVACSTGTSTTAVPSQTTTPSVKQSSPTPTSLPAGTVLYQADWSHGLSGLPGAHGWKVVQGQLENDSSGSATLTIPYQLTVSDYAIEFRLQVVRSLPPYGGNYEMVAPKLQGKDGYNAGIFDLKAPGPHPFGLHPQSSVYLNPPSPPSPASGMPADYEPGSGWHIYRVEVRGNEVNLLDNGTQIGSASSQRTGTLSNGPLEFNCSQVMVRLSDLRILTL